MKTFQILRTTNFIKQRSSRQLPWLSILYNLVCNRKKCVEGGNFRGWYLTGKYKWKKLTPVLNDSRQISGRDLREKLTEYFFIDDIYDDIMILVEVGIILPTNVCKIFIRIGGHCIKYKMDSTPLLSIIYLSA